MAYQIFYNEISDRYEINTQELHCGDCIEVLICDSEPKWITTRLEKGYNSSCDCDIWYLVGLPQNIRIDGLFANLL